MIPERLLIFSAAGEEFALNLQEVCEVMEPQPSYPFAGAPPHYLGLINFHGNLTALVDLGMYLGKGGRGAPGKLLVLDTKLAHLALGVDGVSSIVSGETVTGEAPGEEPLIEARLETAAGTVRLLEVEALLRGLEEGLREAPPRPQP
ncbi:MAG TPA: chemotaxis protein CheW [Geobacter sp.]|nr:chemotaxis protein CheW [Geobacter sp.]